MRYLFRFFGLLIALAILTLSGCALASKVAKTDQAPADAQTKAQSATPSAQSLEKPHGASDEELKKLLEPPPSPQQFKSQLTPKTKAEGESGVDLIEKDEVNRLALEFARQIPNVKHVKTCFSKLYGGWYMLLYVQKGKKVALDQYSWSPATKEWEIIYRLKEIPAKQLDAHVKGEVGDEKCFVLK